MSAQSVWLATRERVDARFARDRGSVIRGVEAVGYADYVRGNHFKARNIAGGAGLAESKG